MRGLELRRAVTEPSGQQGYPGSLEGLGSQLADAALGDSQDLADLGEREAVDVGVDEDRPGSVREVSECGPERVDEALLAPRRRQAARPTGRQCLGKRQVLIAGLGRSISSSAAIRVRPTWPRMRCSSVGVIVERLGQLLRRWRPVEPLLAALDGCLEVAGLLAYGSRNPVQGAQLVDTAPRMRVTAYVSNLSPRSGSNRSTASISPKIPDWMRSE